MIPITGRFLSLAATALLSPFALAQGPLTIGNIVVVRIGDGTASGTNAATPTYLDEYTPTGTFVQSIPLPTTASGGNFACTNSGTSTSEGQLNVSTNGLYLTLGGYDAPVGTTVGTAGVPGTSVATVRRVIARVDLNGVVDTSTGLTDAYDAGNIRAVATDDGQRFWTTGSLASGPTSGVRLAANLGATTSTSVTIGGVNARQITVFHENLYLTTASTSGGVYGIAQLGTGLPTGASALTPLPGFPVVSGPSPYDMFWANPTTVYVADDQTGGAGGIQKWVLNAGTWTKLYTLALNPSTGCTGVTGFVQNGVTTLWATARSGTTTQVVTVVDAGPGSPVTSIVATPPAGFFRGIRRIGLPPITQRYPVGCGAANIKVTGNAELGTDVFVSVTNSAFNFSLIGYGLVPIFFPFCNCTIAHEWQVFFGAQDHTLNISPTWGAVLGMNIYAQAVDLLAPGGCADPLITLTEAVQFQVQ